MLKDPMNYIMLIIFPVILISVTTLSVNVEGTDFLRYGFDPFATGQTSFNALFFQFFCGMIVADILYLEFRSDMRWRLMATPKPFSSFVRAGIAASIIVSIINGVVVFSFGRFVLNAHLHNLFISSVTLLTLAMFVTFIGVLCFMLIPKKSITTALIMVFAFAQLLPVQFNMINIDIGSIGLASFIPVVAANNAMMYSGIMMLEIIDGNIIWHDTDMRMSLIHLGILASYMLAAGIAIVILGRKRPI